MTKINFLLTGLITAALFLLVGILPSRAMAAPRVFFDPASLSASKDSTFDIYLKIDTDLAAASSDVSLNYTGADIEIQSISNGGFFSNFGQAFDTSRIEIHGYFSNLYETKTGAGNLAKITFVAKKDSGSTSLSFACSGSGNDTQILDANGNNILSCSSVNSASITFAPVTITQATPTPATNTTSSTTNEANSCGGTCGSNANCKSGLYCYQGFCKNPSCQTDTDCLCPTTQSTTKPKTAKPSIPQPVELLAYSPPTANASPTVNPTPPPATEEKNKGTLTNYLLWGLGTTGLFFLIWAIIRFLRNRNNPPNIPPSAEIKPIAVIPPYAPQAPQPPQAMTTQNNQGSIQPPQAPFPPPQNPLV